MKVCEDDAYGACFELLEHYSPAETAEVASYADSLCRQLNFCCSVSCMFVCAVRSPEQQMRCLFNSMEIEDRVILSLAHAL